MYGLYEDIYYDQLPSEQVPIYTFLEPLLLGANSAAHITFGENYLEIAKFYLIDLPWMALNQRFMEDYEVNGSYHKISYDEDTFVEIDYKQNSYTVQVDGHVIATNYTTIFPKDEDTFLIFSQNEKTLSVTVSEDWLDQNKYIIKLSKLTETGVVDGIPFDIDGRALTFNAKACTPYKLVRSAYVPPVIYVNNNDITCGGNTPCYVTIQEAINSVQKVAVIKIAQGSYNEGIILNDGNSLTLKGGWDSSYVAQTANTTFIKAPKVPKGSLRLQMVTIKP